MIDFKKLKESTHIEFKSSFDKETIMTLVAFANTIGGKVIIGMNDKGRVRGVDVMPETEQRYLNRFYQSRNTVRWPYTGRSRPG